MVAHRYPNRFSTGGGPQRKDRPVLDGPGIAGLHQARDSQQSRQGDGFEDQSSPEIRVVAESSARNTQAQNAGGGQVSAGEPDDTTFA